MQSLNLAVLLLLSCSVFAGSFRARELQSLSHLQEELKMLHKSEEAIVSNFINGLQIYDAAKSRGLRESSSSKKITACGAKLIAYARSICNETQEGTNENFATKCCSYGCDEDYIRKALCPNK